MCQQEHSAILNSSMDFMSDALSYGHIEYTRASASIMAERVIRTLEQGGKTN